MLRLSGKRLDQPRYFELWLEALPLGHASAEQVGRHLCPPMNSFSPLLTVRRPN